MEQVNKEKYNSEWAWENRLMNKHDGVILKMVKIIPVEYNSGIYCLNCENYENCNKGMFGDYGCCLLYIQKQV